MLVCKWIDDDMKQFWKIKYIEQNYSKWNEQLISDYHLLEVEFRDWKDKYLKSLTKVKMWNIIDHIMKPILEQRKKYYEEHYNHELNRRREIERQKLVKRFKREDVVLPF